MSKSNLGMLGMEELKDDEFPVSTLSDKRVIFFREISTDIMYLAYEGGGMAVFRDPETGRPMTYDHWKEKYGT